MLNGENGSAIYVIDSDYKIVYFDKGLEKYFPGIKLGEFCYNCLMNEDSVCHYCPKKTEKKKSAVYCDSMGKWLDVECIYIDKKDEEKYTIINLKEIEEYDGNMDKNAVDADMYMRDSLTGLLLKNFFYKRVDDYIKENGAAGSCFTAVDIKQFKLYNEVFGQAAGDFILKKTGNYIRSLEKTKGIIGGHFGSDDFVIFMPYDEKLIDEIYDTIQEYIDVYEQKAGFAPAVGVCVIESEDVPTDILCNNAQAASGAAKKAYGRSICYYSSDMATDISKKRRLFNGIHKGLENNEFTFFLQPKCDILTGKIVSMEALVRWIHPEQGLLPPSEYIPILEESGLIVELDKYVWEKVCSEISKWKKEGIKVVPISINVSIVDIKSMDVPEYLKSLAEKYDVEPANLAVEITETEFAKNSDILKNMVNKLHETGFRVLLDDFGSGYSSLNILKDINIDILKMDMKFLELNEENLNKGRNIVESVLRMAHAMDMWVIAEGVENKIHADVLTALGCAYGQGYYFYRPMPIEEAKKILKSKDTVDDRGIYVKNSEPVQPYKVNEDENASGGAVTHETVKAIADIYFKILKGNLTKDTFEVIKIAEEENVAGAGEIKKFSEWCRSFGKSESIYENDRQTFLDGTDINNLRAHFKRGNNRFGLRYRRKCGGIYRWVILEIFKDAEYTDSNQIVMMYIRDIHDDYVAELYQKRQLEYVSSHDALTKLYNRNRFESDLAKYDKDKPVPAACVYMDAVGLHEVNSTRGHKAGDEMLIYIAETILRYFTGADVYRVGGDEFVVLCTGKGYRDATHGVDKVKEDLGYKGYGISVGIASDDECTDIHKLVNTAEEKMREEKKR